MRTRATHPSPVAAAADYQKETIGGLEDSERGGWGSACCRGCLAFQNLEVEVEVLSETCCFRATLAMKHVWASFEASAKLGVLVLCWSYRTSRRRRLLVYSADGTKS